MSAPIGDWSTLLRKFLDTSLAKGLTPLTVKTRERGLVRFIAWCEERNLDPPAITLPIL